MASHLLGALPETPLSLTFSSKVTAPAPPLNFKGSKANWLKKSPLCLSVFFFFLPSSYTKFSLSWVVLITR